MSGAVIAEYLGTENDRDTYTAQKMMSSIKDFFSKCGQICSFLRIWLHLLKKFLMKNFIFCAALVYVKENISYLNKIEPS